MMANQWVLHYRWLTCRLCRRSTGYRTVVGVGGSDRLSRHWELAPQPESASAARQQLRSACADWGLDGEVREDALLIVSELVSNVVDHAGTPCHLTVRMDGEGLRIEVRDLYRCPPPQPRPIDLGARRGRGLQVVSALSLRWGVTEFDDGKSVWSVLAIAPTTSMPPAAW
jgi:anti-sigma regulatory factor (Ser/Thr protein kinase)